MEPQREITATNLPRVLACNGSLLMEASPASIATPQEDREYGIAAHFVAMSVLFGLQSDPVEWVDRQAPNGTYVTPDMVENVGKILDTLAARGYVAQAERALELPCDFECGGYTIRVRPDHIAYDAGSETLYVDDFKFGFRIVEPGDNWTLIAQALGMCKLKGWQPTKIVFTIHQPRAYHPDGPTRSATITSAELVALMVTLDMRLRALTDTLMTGPHCKNCRALSHCGAARLAGYNAIEASTIAFVEDIPNDVLSYELDNLYRARDAINNKLEAYEELAKHRLHESGTSVPGWMIEQSLGNRAPLPGLTPEAIALMTGKSVDEITTRKLITPAAMERLKIDEQIVAAISYRPKTGEKLKRFDPSKVAARLFNT